MKTKGKTTDVTHKSMMIDGYQLPALVPGEDLIGQVTPFTAPIDPDQLAAVEEWLARAGWMLCDGRALSRDEAPLLYMLIGTSHGAGYDNLGGGTQVPGKHFNIPDYRGRFLRGVARDSHRDPDVASRWGMNIGGNKKNLVGSIQDYTTAFPKSGFVIAEAGSHNHSGNTDPEGGHYHKVYYDSGNPSDEPNLVLKGINNRNPSTREREIRTDRTDDHSHAFDTGHAGSHNHGISGGDRETRPINAYVHWIIKFKYVGA